jgi:hypothetical protein
LLGLLLIGSVLLAWELSVRTGAVQAITWPAFSSVVVALVRQLLGGELLGEMLVTLERLFVGYALAVVVGIGLGVLMESRDAAYSSPPANIASVGCGPGPGCVPVAHARGHTHATAGGQASRSRPDGPQFR